jgi:hypothetical protein
MSMRTPQSTCLSVSVSDERPGNQASRQTSRMVKAAGVERERGAFSNLLMARDFWAQRVLSVAVAAAR